MSGETLCVRAVDKAGFDENGGHGSVAQNAEDQKKNTHQKLMVGVFPLVVLLKNQAVIIDGI